MTTESTKALGTYLWQGGQRLNLTKAPDRFSARLRRNVSPDAVEDEHPVEHERSFPRQRLEEFAVDAATRDDVMERVRDADEVEFASHVYAFEGDPTSRVYLTDEITVQFKPEATDEDIEGLTANEGLDLIKEVPGLARAFVFRVTAQATENPIKITNRLAASDSVLAAEVNILVPAQKFYVPTDGLFPEQWHLHNTGGPFTSPEADVDAVQAWDIERGNRGVIVAVIDDSVDLSHAEFQGPGKIVAPRDFVGQDFEPLPEAEDDNHGTACAGVAVAEEDGQGVVGVAPGCALMPIRMNGIDDGGIEDLFGWAMDHGASVISCSWSAAAKVFPLSLRKQAALHRAATLGRNGRGCVLVFAAGNANRPLNGTVNESGWPNALFSGPTQWSNGFATHTDVIAVSACTSQARKSAYSNWGREIAVCAPSNNGHPSTMRFTPTGWVGILTYPRITIPLNGRGIVTADRVGAPGYSSTDFTFSFGGTSSACPLVAGIAALVLSANPVLTASEVRDILQSTADKIVDIHPDPQLGNSFGAYDANGHSQWFGFGKVNAFRAVQEAVRRKSPENLQTLRRESSPRLPIPDNTSAGVRDSLQFDESGIVASVRVHMDIVHTYRGDLRVTLIAPSGRSVILHQTSGDSAMNLQGTFDAASTPALAGLANEPVQGTWTLHVQDLVALDIGTLNRWELEMELRPDAVVEVVETPGVLIPDNNPAGIERTLAVEANGTVDSVEVSVDITHTFIRDLVITLLSPTGMTARLHQRSGGSSHNIQKTYTPATTPDLHALHGQAFQGDWKLKVADLEALDLGRLNRWALKIVRQV